MNRRRVSYSPVDAPPKKWKPYSGGAVPSPRTGPGKTFRGSANSKPASNQAPLNNARHEAFCRALCEGHSIDESYSLAGYSKNRGNASRLNANENIRTRLAELQAQAAASSEVTVASICRELDEANAVAKAKGQAAAMVSAATLRAKLAGLMVEKVEVGSPGDFDNLHSIPQIVDRVLERLVEQFRPFDEQDRQGLIELYQRHMQEIEEYLAAIRARPIVAERVDTRRLGRPWQELEPHSVKRVGYRTNGSAKPQG